MNFTRRIRTAVTLLTLPVATFSMSPASLAAPAETVPIDFNRARQLLQKERSGQTLTADERGYLERAKAARRGQQKQGTPNRTGRPAPTTTPVSPPLAVSPLIEFASDELYKGETGGLYGAGRNEPPAEHQRAALAAAGLVRPLDAGGRPADDGKIVLLSIGMSNTTMASRRFKELADADPAKSARVTIVDGAQGGQDARITADPAAPFWTNVEERIRKAGTTPAQVQVVWIKQAIARASAEFPAEAKRLRDYLAATVRNAKARFPNARLCYLSSRTYGGYALTPLSPEPHAFEGAFAVRWLIDEQISRAPALNHDAGRGPVKAPVLLWGPYLWTNGEKPRKSDGFFYRREDFTDRDGTHPTASGQQKVAELLLNFFKIEPTARRWFVAEKAPRP